MTDNNDDTSESKCPQDNGSTIGSFLDDLPSLVEKAGLGQECKKEAKSLSSNASLSMNLDLPFGAGADGQMSAVFNNASMSESGCGQKFLNLVSVHKSKSVINCIINSDTTETTTHTAMNNSITFDTLQLTQTESDAYNQAITSLTDDSNISNLLIALADREGGLEFAKILIQSKADRLEKINEMFSRDVVLIDTDITQKISGEIITSISISENAAQLIAAEQNALTQSVAEASVASELGAQSGDPNITGMVLNSQNDEQKFTSVDVTKTVTSLNTEIGTNNNLTMKVAGRIILNNVTIDQDIALKVVTEALTNKAITRGLELAQASINKAASEVSADTSSAGVDAIIAALGKNNKDAINAAKSNRSLMFIIGIGLVIVLIVVLLLFFKKK